MPTIPLQDLATGATVRPTTIRPRNDTVVVEKIGGNTTSGGILLPDSYKAHDRYLVLAIGPGDVTQRGQLRPPTDLAVGDVVILQDDGYETKDGDGVMVNVIPQAFIFCKVLPNALVGAGLTVDPTPE